MSEILDGIAGPGNDSNSLGLLLSEDGPWANDTVSCAYTYTLRTRLTAQRPGTTDWTLGYTSDGVNRLRFLSVPTSSTVEYRYAGAGDSLPPVSRLPTRLGLEQYYTTRAYDALARLTLDRLRHEERLRVHARVEPGVEAEPIPPLLLHPLVENAVKHGIDQKIEGVGVTYAVWKDPAGMHVRVTNGGRLLESARPGGTGLRNANTRLELLYGKAAFLKVAQAGDQVVAGATWPSADRSLADESPTH